MKIKKGKTKEGENRYFFQCPGCNQEHAFNDGWQFNNDFKNPTISPSIKVTMKYAGKTKICHSFIKNGMIQFLNDCTHKLAGKTVELISY